MSPYQRPEKPVPEASDWPRKYVTTTLPLGRRHYGEITLPLRMSATEWDAVFAFLDIQRRVSEDPRLGPSTWVRAEERVDA